MSNVWLLFPDLALIALGYLLRRSAERGLTRFDTAMWAGVERLVYFVLFPALLFGSTASARLSVGTTLPMVGLAAAAIMMAAALALGLQRLVSDDARDRASMLQCAFRFNSYMGLALAHRLGGDEGVARMAVIVGVAVPLANAIAVTALARHSGAGIGRELARNPLLVSTLAGLACNLAGVSLPEPLAAALSRLGQAAVALGLLAVGAGLTLTQLSGARAHLGLVSGIKLLAMPALALAAARLTGLPSESMQSLVLFCALPTASSAYILAARMGGNGPLVAAAITASTLASMVTLPAWVAFTAG